MEIMLTKLQSYLGTDSSLVVVEHHALVVLKLFIDVVENFLLLLVRASDKNVWMRVEFVQL